MPVARSLQYRSGMNLNANTAALLAAKLDQVRETYPNVAVIDLKSMGHLASIQTNAAVKRQYLLALAAQALLLAEAIETEAQAADDAILAEAEAFVAAQAK